MHPTRSTGGWDLAPLVHWTWRFLLKQAASVRGKLQWVTIEYKFS